MTTPGTVEGTPGGARPCCADPVNRLRVEAPAGHKGHVAVERCRVCGAQHYRTQLAPVVMRST